MVVVALGWNEDDDPRGYLMVVVVVATGWVMIAGSFLSIDGVRVHWVELGEGRPLVLLHGLGDSHRTWSLVARRLARSRRVLMVDLPGHGLSGRPDASYTLEWHADVVAAWLNALHLGDVELVGHSYGGGVAEWMLLEHAPRIRKLALVAAGGLGREVTVSLRLAALPYFVERLGQPFMAPGTRLALFGARGRHSGADIVDLARMNATPGTARAFARSVRDVIDWRGQRRAFFDRWSEIAVLPEVGLFWGERDPVIPIAHAVHAAAKLGGAELKRFASCGHYPHLEEPELFSEALLAFLDRPSSIARRSSEGPPKKARAAVRAHAR